MKIVFQITLLLLSIFCIQNISACDGPYVLWENDSSVIVIYENNSNLDSQTFYFKDSLLFNGFCNDSNRNYLIKPIISKSDPSEYKNISKVYALSDIHGEYDFLFDNLVKTKIIDNNGRWIYGQGHLVIDGDVFDRGAKPTECLWLIYSLEQQAENNGGMVHFLLGNHEMMILRADNRYINEKYLKGIVKKTRIRHEDLYGQDSHLGQWLRNKNTATKINNTLFVHAGISPSMMDKNYKLDSLNNAIRKTINLRSSELFMTTNDSKFLLGSKGPLWYRGYHYEMENRYPKITLGQVDNILEFYEVDRIIVGHTENDSLLSLFDNKIISIDVPVYELNGFQGLMIENDKLFKVSPAGEKIELSN